MLKMNISATSFQRRTCYPISAQKDGILLAVRFLGFGFYCPLRLFHPFSVEPIRLLSKPVCPAKLPDHNQGEKLGPTCSELV